MHFAKLIYYAVVKSGESWLMTGPDKWSVLHTASAWPPIHPVYTQSVS